MAVQIALHFALTIAWVVLTDHADFVNLVVGIVIGAIIIGIYERTRGERFYMTRVYSAVKLFVVLVWEQMKSSVQVARIVLSRKIEIRPGIVAVPLDPLTDMELTAVANMITLTPGTVSVDVSEDRRTLYVHVIHMDDRDKASEILDAKDRFQSLVLGVTR